MKLFLQNIRSPTQQKLKTKMTGTKNKKADTNWICYFSALLNFFWFLAEMTSVRILDGAIFKHYITQLFASLWSFVGKAARLHRSRFRARTCSCRPYCRRTPDSVDRHMVHWRIARCRWPSSTRWWILVECTAVQLGIRTAKVWRQKRWLVACSYAEFRCFVN